MALEFEDTPTDHTGPEGLSRLSWMGVQNLYLAQFCVSCTLTEYTWQFFGVHFFSSRTTRSILKERA
jgi:hypothetical protein